MKMFAHELLLNFKLTPIFSRISNINRQYTIVIQAMNTNGING